MNPSEELKAKANSPEPQVSEEGQAAAGRIAAARAKADNTITSESLAPQAEVQVTDPQTGTAMAGLGGALEAQTDSFAQGLADTTNQREAASAASTRDYQSLVANRTGLEGFSLQADQDAGVFEADSALQDINNELRTEQLGRRRSVEALQGQGNLKGTTQSQVNNINRESYSKQADMAIVQLAAQGRFNSASALADRKANAMFEQEQNQIDAAKITYEDNKDLYNKAEQREFETALTDRTNRVQAEKEQMQAVQNLALQAQLDGAPQAIVSEMMKSKTLADASALGGQFVGALDREQQRASIRSSNASARASDALTNERAYNSLIARAEAGDSEAIAELGIVTEGVDNVGIYGEMANSVGGKPLPAGAIVSLEKAITVASQLNTLSSLFQDDRQLRGLTDENGNEIGVDLAPITKAFRSNNPFDVKAQQITASINAIIPNLARGIYGEVGVLTDTDVTRYAQTIPNLGSVEEVQDAMLAMTMKTVKNSVQNKLVINARNGADVSQQIATLEQLEGTVGAAMLPLNQKTTEYNALVQGGADPQELDSLLLQGFELDQVISHYTGQ